jgi:hypothetical protein
MRKFKSEDKFVIGGKGTVYTLHLEETMPRKEVLNQEIEVDGTVYKCTGIEQFAIRLSDPLLYKGDAVGLLVQKI